MLQGCKLGLVGLAWAYLACAGAAGLLENGSFENGAVGWSNVDGVACKVERGFGRNQSGGLRYQREDAKDYQLVRTRIAPPSPGVKYRFGAWVKPEKLQGAANIAVEVSRNGEYLYGTYSAELSGASEEWQLLEVPFMTQGENPQECEYVATLYLRRESTGTAFFDDVSLKEDAPEWVVAQSFPTHRRIAADRGEFELTSYCFGEFVPAGAAMQVRLELRREGRVVNTVTVPVEAGAVRGAFGAVAPGEAELLAILLDGEGAELARRPLAVTVVDPELLSDSSGVKIDAQGRTRVNGELFLPVGLFAGKLTPEVVQTIASGPFNCVMPYGSMDEEFPVEAVLEELTENDLKIIFSVKDVFEPGISVGSLTHWEGIEGADAIVRAVVERYRNHPALLAWYICDETPRDKLDHLVARRKLVNELDPNHPTWSVFYQMTEIPYYLESCDILGVDPYPVMNAAPGNLQLVDQMGRQTAQTTAPVWAVPQAHNLGNYDSATVGDLAAYRKLYRDPSEEEMLAIAVLEAIYGAKGFILYSFFDLADGPDPEQFERRWPEVCQVAEHLAGLKDFLLADLPPESVGIVDETGTVRAKLFADGQGRGRLLIAGCASGLNQAALAADGWRFLRSTTGRTQAEADGTLRFSGENIVCDIVELEKK